MEAGQHLSLFPTRAPRVRPGRGCRGPSPQTLPSGQRGEKGAIVSRCPSHLQWPGVPTAAWRSVWLCLLPTAAWSFGFRGRCGLWKLPERLTIQETEFGGHPRASSWELFGGMLMPYRFMVLELLFCRDSPIHFPSNFLEAFQHKSKWPWFSTGFYQYMVICFMLDAVKMVQGA